MRVFHPLSCLLSLTLVGLCAMGLSADTSVPSTLSSNIER
jgi:hypothetical protein